MSRPPFFDDRPEYAGGDLLGVPRQVEPLAQIRKNSGSGDLFDAVAFRFLSPLEKMKQAPISLAHLCRSDHISTTAKPGENLFLCAGWMQIVTQLLKDRIMLDEFLPIVQERLQRLPHGQTFTLPKLLEDRWPHEHGDANQLGREFKEYVVNGRIPEVEHDHTDGANLNHYRRI